MSGDFDLISDKEYYKQLPSGTPLDKHLSIIEIKERLDKAEKAIKQLRGMMFKKK